MSNQSWRKLARKKAERGKWQVTAMAILNATTCRRERNDLNLADSVKDQAAEVADAVREQVGEFAEGASEKVQKWGADVATGAKEQVASLAISGAIHGINSSAELP